jgi:vancomycin permeability regulator SanA
MLFWSRLKIQLRYLKVPAIALSSSVAIAVVLLYGDGAHSELQRADYAIVYGNQVQPNGIPSKRLQARLDRAEALFQAGQVTGIMVSGGIGKEGYDEALVMAQYLQQKGIPQTQIVVDSVGYNSHFTAVSAAQLLGTNHSVIAVSQLYHLSRAKLSLRNNGFTAVGSAYPLFFEVRDLYSSLREIPAWLQYWFLVI